jgi:hypothetical protein
MKLPKLTAPKLSENATNLAVLGAGAAAVGAAAAVAPAVAVIVALDIATRNMTGSTPRASPTPSPIEQAVHEATADGQVTAAEATQFAARVDSVTNFQPAATRRSAYNLLRGEAKEHPPTLEAGAVKSLNLWAGVSDPNP